MRRLINAALYVAALSSCAGQAPNVSDRAIRVLVVTATQGWRHTEPIEVSKERLKALDSSAGFRFDFTEDPADLNAKKLSQYDVLFLNNSTLRIRRRRRVIRRHLQRSGGHRRGSPTPSRGSSKTPSRRSCAEARDWPSSTQASTPFTAGRHSASWSEEGCSRTIPSRVRRA